jgi:hypothetical protein
MRIVACLVAILLLLGTGADAAFFGRGASLGGIPSPGGPTIWSPTDKGAGMTLTAGNLTATGSSTTTWKSVRASTGKFSGKWCYQFHVNAAVSNFNIGFAAADWPNNRSTLGTDDVGQAGIPVSVASAGIAGDGTIRWANQTLAGDAPTTGKTGEICADLDQKPPQFWITSDVTATTGHNGGPRWNGGATADPVGEIGGKQMWLGFGGRVAKAHGNGCCVFPIFESFASDSVTGIFGGFTAPTRFSTWDTAGGEVPVPGPMDPMTMNVANAPTWQPSHSYSLGDRVLAGPAWNGSAYTNGQDLCLFAVKVAGTSGASQAALNTACSSGTAANYGGGENGNIPAQWTGATTVTDGPTWVLLTKVDYVTLTGALNDDPAIWTPSTTFTNSFKWLLKGNDSYRSTYDSGGCTTGLTGPGPGNTNLTGDGTCKWNWTGNITYSSKRNVWPHMVGYPPLTVTNVEQAFYWDTYINIWWGGTQRSQYQCGQNNETIPILAVNHTFMEGDVGYSGYHVGGVIGLPYVFGWNGIVDMQWFRGYYTPPPGDSFRDNMVAGVDPVRYNPAKGTAVYCPASSGELQLVDNGGLWTTAFSAISFTDGWATVRGMQLKSENSSVTGFSITGQFLDGNILDSGNTHVVESVASGMYRDNVIVSRSTDPNCFAIEAKYRVALINNTIVSNGCKAALLTFNSDGINIWGADPDFSAPGGGPAFYGNLILGFQWDHAVGDAFGNGPPSLYWPVATQPFISSGNATSGTDFTQGNTFSPPLSDPFGGVTWYTQSFGGYSSTCGPSNAGPCTGLSAASQLVNPTPGVLFDATLKPTADVKGAGSNISTQLAPTVPVPGFFASVFATEPAMTAPANDVMGTPRPTGQVDIGAYEIPR